MGKARTLLLTAVVLGSLFEPAQAKIIGLYRFKAPEGFFYAAKSLRHPVDYTDGESVFQLSYDPPREQVLALSPLLNYYVAAKEVAPLSEEAPIQLVWEILATKIDGDSVTIEFKPPLMPPALSHDVHPAVLSQISSDARHLSLMLNPSHTQTPRHSILPKPSRVVELTDTRPNEITTAIDLQFSSPLRGYSFRWTTPRELNIAFTFPETTQPIVFLHAAQEPSEIKDPIADLARKATSSLASSLRALGVRATLPQTDDRYIPPRAFIQQARDHKTHLFIALTYAEAPPALPASLPAVTCTYEHAISRTAAKQICFFMKSSGITVREIVQTHSPYTHDHHFPSLLIQIFHSGKKTPQQDGALLKALAKGIANYLLNAKDK